MNLRKIVRKTISEVTLPSGPHRQESYDRIEDALNKLLPKFFEGLEYHLGVKFRGPERGPIVDAIRKALIEELEV